jgi:hypothetical protein
MKKLISYRIDSVQNIITIEYFDNLGIVKIIIIPIVEIFNGNDIQSEIENYITDNTLVPLSKAMVKEIKIENGTFAISGEIFPLKLKVINDLSLENKSIYEAFNDFISQYTGSNINSLSSVLGTGSVTINEIEYNSLSNPTYNQLYQASNGTMRESTMMGIKIFNEI